MLRLAVSLSLSPSAYSRPSRCSYHRLYIIYARIKFCYCPDSFFRSLSFYVVALLAARHSVAVDYLYPSLSYVVALLAACHSVVDCHMSLSLLLRSRCMSSLL